MDEGDQGHWKGMKLKGDFRQILKKRSDSIPVRNSGEASGYSEKPF
jgi:hypothetical protein